MDQRDESFLNLGEYELEAFECVTQLCSENMKCDERSARHSYNEGRIKFGKKMYFELGSWEENRIFGRKGEKAKFETIFGKPW